jgi:hypothetical protein
MIGVPFSYSSVSGDKLTPPPRDPEVAQDLD